MLRNRFRLQHESHKTNIYDISGTLKLLYWKWEGQTKSSVQRTGTLGRSSSGSKLVSVLKKLQSDTESYKIDTETPQSKGSMRLPRLTHWGRDKMAAVLQTTLSNAFSWMKMLEFRLGFHWFVPKGPINNNLALVQITAWHLPGGKQLSEPMMVCLLKHICVTRPQ